MMFLSMITVIRHAHHSSGLVLRQAMLKLTFNIIYGNFILNVHSQKFAKRFISEYHTSVWK